MECLFTNLQSILKISLLFKKNTNLSGQIITPEFFGLTMRNFQGIVFIWTRTYSEIFKSTLVYL